MDNQNNPNLPNPNPTSPFGAPPQPLPDQGNLPPQTPPPPPTPSWPPLPPTQPQSFSPLPTDPIQSPPDSPTPAAWPTVDTSQQAAPITSEPITVQPSSDTLPPQDQIPTWTPPAQDPQPEPISSPALSPLDNPWQAPSQPPSIDGSGAAIQPSWAAIPNTPVPPTPSESAPTDLSHLINSSQEIPQPPPETLVVPSAITPNPEVSTLSTEKHKGIPKWVIGLGIGLLVLVIGATAYLILGIGQPTKTTSLPAEVKPSAPVTAPTGQPSKQPIASGAANFGELGGGSSGETPATSAAELLRQRQQQGR